MIALKKWTQKGRQLTKIYKKCFSLYFNLIILIFLCISSLFIECHLLAGHALFYTYGTFPGEYHSFEGEAETQKAMLKSSMMSEKKKMSASLVGAGKGCQERFLEEVIFELNFKW